MAERTETVGTTILRLSLAEQVVLALVDEGTTHGFAVARLLEPEASVGQVYHVPRPVVYRAMERLIEAGLIRQGRVEAGNRGPRRTLVSATPAGRRISQRWLSAPVPHVRDIRTEFLVKLALLERTGRSCTELIDAQKRMLQPIVTALGHQCAETAGFERALAAWRFETAQAALRFLESYQT